jgi:hypothetical protein
MGRVKWQPYLKMCRRNRDTAAAMFIAIGGDTPRETRYIVEKHHPDMLADFYRLRRAYLIERPTFHDPENDESWLRLNEGCYMRKVFKST